MPTPRIAILGAGPVGLHAALAAVDRGFPFTVYEASDRCAGHVRSWGHVGLFSPWSMNASSRMRRHLAAAGVEVPDGDGCPTGAELVERVLEPVAALPAVEPRVRTGTRVVAVGREGLLKHEAIGDPERAGRPFRILSVDAGGRERVDRADVVLDCTGTWANPNATGDGGIPAPGEAALGQAIRRTVPDVEAEADEWAGRTILLVGAGHSAQTAAAALAGLAERRPGTRVVWVVKDDEPGWGAVPDDPLPARAALAERARELAGGAVAALELRTGAVVDAFEPPSGGRVDVRLRRSDGQQETVTVDRVLSLTGYVGDHRLYRQLQVHECYATSGPMKLAASLLATGSDDCLAGGAPDPDVLSNPEPGFYLLGAKSYGRNSAFLMRTGWQQVDGLPLFG